MPDVNFLTLPSRLPSEVCIFPSITLRYLLKFSTSEMNQNMVEQEFV